MASPSRALSAKYLYVCTEQLQRIRGTQSKMRERRRIAVVARILGKMVMTKRVSVTGIISIPAPPFKRGGHFVASSLHFWCRWRKNWAKRRGFARSGALCLPGAGHGLLSGVLARCWVAYGCVTSCCDASDTHRSTANRYKRGISSELPE